MKKLELNNAYSSVENFRNIISEFIDELEIDSYKNEQKIKELCHVGKFLMFFDNQYKIEKLSEEPDFIISNIKTRIGLEHQILIDSKTKEKEGFFCNLVKLAEQEIRKDKSLPNFLANIYAHSSFHAKISDKQRLVNEIIQIVTQYIHTGILLENEIIERIFSMRHSRITLNPNLGAWWQKILTEDLLKDAIQKKEKEIDNYRKNTNTQQWLLIVIGGIGGSSYQLESEINLSIDTRFEKIFVLEDMSTRLYEIK